MWSNDKLHNIKVDTLHVEASLVSLLKINITEKGGSVYLNSVNCNNHSSLHQETMLTNYVEEFMLLVALISTIVL